MNILRLGEIAYARSGDKGSHVNIGVIAYTFEHYQTIEEQLTTKNVSNFLKTLNPSEVIRYELPNLWALNFIIKDILDGGGNRCLHIDAQGKALGQLLLEIPLNVPFLRPGVSS